MIQKFVVCSLCGRCPCCRQWHVRLFAILAAVVLEGKNPFNFVAKSIHDPKADKFAILPGVARVALSIYSCMLFFSWVWNRAMAIHVLYALM